MVNMYTAALVLRSPVFPGNFRDSCPRDGLTVREVYTMETGCETPLEPKHTRGRVIPPAYARYLPNLFTNEGRSGNCHRLGGTAFVS